MNTDDIELFLRADSVCRRVFQGVFSLDTLPTNPTLLISNTDPSTKPGRHWVAIFVDENARGEYFDSFGEPPSRHFRDYMNRHCCEWVFNKRQLQSIISTFCGFYCCMYVMLRSRGVELNCTVALFTSDTGFNDSIVHSFVCNKIF